MTSTSGIADHVGIVIGRPRCRLARLSCLVLLLAAASCTTKGLGLGRLESGGWLDGGTSFDRSPLRGLEQLLQAGPRVERIGASGRALLGAHSSSMQDVGGAIADEFARAGRVADSLERLGRRGVRLERR